jgi:hypothetical protein
MERVRGHLNIVSALSPGQIDFVAPDLNAELMFLHLRKALEEMAFSSLCANVGRYCQAHADYASKWAAKRLLEGVGKLNPDFYPVPIHFNGGTPSEPGAPHLTRDDFIFLYDLSSSLLHSWNPYRTEAPPDLKYTVPEWLARFHNLLRTHSIRMIDDEEIWIVLVPSEGPIQVGRSRLVGISQAMHVA